MIASYAIFGQGAGWCRHTTGSRTIAQAIVQEFLDYDPETGVLTWRWRDRKWFKTDNAFGTWNTRYALQPTGSFCKNGYLDVGIFDRLYKAHRVIFLWMEGRWPDPEVDHDNRNRADNRWLNLVEATNNTSGRVGVSRIRNGKFEAKIGVDYRTIHLGIHDTFEDACSARETAERCFGFHKDHGSS